MAYALSCLLSAFRTTVLGVASMALSVACVGEPRSRARLVGASSCPATEWPLISVKREQSLLRVYIDVRFEDEPALLLLDTGAGGSLLADTMEDLRHGMGRVSVSGCVVGLPYRAVDLVESYQGRRVVGIIGFDMLEKETVVVDTKAEKLTFVDSDAPELRGPDWDRVPLELQRHTAIVEAKLSGVPLRLVLDTGAPDTVLVDPNLDFGGRERPIGSDVFDNTLRGVKSSELLELGARKQRAQVYRTREWPAYSQAPPGMAVSGVLGLATLQAQRFVLDFRNSQLWIARE